MRTDCALLSGFRDLEQSAEGSFRWSGTQFSLLPPREAEWLRLEFAFLGSGGILAATAVGGGDVESVPLEHGWQTRLLRLRRPAGPIDCKVCAPENIGEPPPEPGLMIREITMAALPRSAASLADSRLILGGYRSESSPDGGFVWTRPTWEMRLPRNAGFLRLECLYLGLEGELRLTRAGELFDQARLRHGWQRILLRVPRGADQVEFVVEPPRFADGDDRQLGVRLREVDFSDDEASFRDQRKMLDNLALNNAEFRRGLPIVTSFPTMLRVTSEVRCNIPETSRACAYCAWDWAKTMESEAPPFRLETLDQLGDFYRSAATIVDCSIGEPTMNKQFGAIVARVDRDGKELSLTTNGQLLGERRRREVLGKALEIYVSIDAATAAGFARYRNDRFDDLIANLRALCLEKRAHANLPTVYASFIIMRSNVDELPAYLDLMKDVGVDRVKLRALYLDDNVDPVVINNGYRFDYAAEIVPMPELIAIAPAARRLAAERGMPLYVEWEEFEAESQHAPDEPLCAEPWKTLYVLSRGMMVCCYATEPLARWSEQGDRSLEQFLRDVFNSDKYQRIRSELAAGRLPQHCRDTPSCPVLKRLAHAGHDAELRPPVFKPRGVADPPPSGFSLPVLAPACGSAIGCGGVSQPSAG